jgi:hypothetical protein
MRDYPNRSAHSSLWTPPAKEPDLPLRQVETIEALLKMLDTPTAPAIARRINDDFARRRCRYRLALKGGPPRR